MAESFSDNLRVSASLDTRAKEIATWLAHDENHLSHSRRIGVEDLRRKGLDVFDMRDLPQLHEAIRQLHLVLSNSLKTAKGSRSHKELQSKQSQLVPEAAVFPLRRRHKRKFNVL